MLARIYAHNFRCYENFDFQTGGIPSALLIGKNGSGKSTLRYLLRIFQGIGRGRNRVGELVSISDFSHGRVTIPMRLEIDVRLNGYLYTYALAMDLPENFRELRVLEEELTLNEKKVFSRKLAQVTIHKGASSNRGVTFNVDWHLLALPVIQDPTAVSALSTFRDWLSRIVILSPIPKLMKGDAGIGTLAVSEDGDNLADWLSGVFDGYPAAYAIVIDYLKKVMVDVVDFRFEKLGREAKSLWVRFRDTGSDSQSGQEKLELLFDVLSDGEKCFFLCAVVLAANQVYGPIFTFWDEPDNHLSLSEVSQFVAALRQGFEVGGQILMTSHNSEAIRRFSRDSTWVLGRRSHLEPTVIRQLQELSEDGQELIARVIEGDIDPW
ncbi:AAA family ATPase [Rhodanobacter aciditrophus]|uniref:AAA family ATPase n=1 Tax=Rhodanobacter aciditrophus TaxID=1623218 RepID=UPI003CEEBFAA